MLYLLALFYFTISPKAEFWASKYKASQVFMRTGQMRFCQRGAISLQRMQAMKIWVCHCSTISTTKAFLLWSRPFSNQALESLRHLAKAWQMISLNFRVPGPSLRVLYHQKLKAPDAMLATLIHDGVLNGIEEGDTKLLAYINPVQLCCKVLRCLHLKRHIHIQASQSSLGFLGIQIIPWETLLLTSLKRGISWVSHTE